MKAPTPVDVLNTPNVNVVNTTTNAVPIIGTVQDADNPARQAVQQRIPILFSTGAVNGQSNPITIPAGKIFVLESVTFSAVTTLSGGVVAVAAVGITVTGPLITGGQNQVTHNLTVPPLDPNQTAAGSQALRLYAQPTTPLVVSMSVNLNDPADPVDAIATVSGYFVNAQ